MAYTIAEHEANMTVYYSKSTGNLKGVYSGIQDMGAFGTDAEDYALIWALKVIPNDSYVLANPNLFIMDVKGSEPVLSLKEAIGNVYPVIT